MDTRGGVVVSQAAFDRAFPRPANKLTLIDGAVASAVVLTSLALLPYVDGGGLITALAFIGLVQGLDLVARTGRGLAGMVRRTATRPVRE